MIRVSNQMSYDGKSGRSAIVLDLGDSQETDVLKIVEEMCQSLKVFHSQRIIKLQGELTMALAGDSDCLIQMAESDVTKPYIQGRVKELLNSALVSTQEQTIARLTQDIARIKIHGAQEAQR